MQTIERSLLLPLNAKMLFDIIKNIPEYPQFLPYVHDAKIHEQEASRVTASLIVKYGKFMHALTTENIEVNPLELKFTLVDGPFESLMGYWKIIELTPTASKVEFNIQFKLNAALSKLGLKRLITGSVEYFIAAFENHAKNSLNEKTWVDNTAH